MTFFQRLIAFLIPIFCALAVTIRSGEPKTADPPEKKGNYKNLENLGFSVVPKSGGKARTSFFGLVGEGYKFVYVLDRSGSMGADGNAALKALKTELLASLKNLDSVHQFQVIFYNQRPVLFCPSGIPGKQVFATDRNKTRLRKFLDSIGPQGGTDHEAALRMAVSLKPDVVFFLTDGDQPQLTPPEMEKIVGLSAGIHINVIQFGSGPPAGDNFLKELASRTAGTYSYIDTQKFSSTKAQLKKPFSTER